MWLHFATTRRSLRATALSTRRRFLRSGFLPAGAQLQREGFRFPQPFQLFAEGQAAVEQAVEFPTALGGAPAPVRLNVERLFHRARCNSSMSVKSCGRPAARFIFRSVSSVTTGAKTPPTEACRGCGNMQMLARDEHALVAAEQVLSLCPKIYLPLNSRSHSFSNARMLSNLGGSPKNISRIFA
jgi:hypothetical protein